MKKKKVLQTGLFLGLLIFIFLISSCVTTRSPISQSGIFHSSHGFSIQFPVSDTWDIKKMDKAVIAFKKPQVGFRSFFLGAEESTLNQKFRNPEEFLLFVKNSMGVGSFSERHEMIQADYSLKPEITPYCVYYSLKYKDYAARNIGNNSFLIIETTGYYLLHPNSPKLGFNAFHSERYLDKHDPDLQLAGNNYLKSLKVTSSNKAE